MRNHYWTIGPFADWLRGYYVQFVGRRPFDDDSDSLWEIMEYGQDVLDAETRLEDRLQWK